MLVYNAIGQKVAELLDEQMEQGYHKIDFYALNPSSDFYFYRLETPDYFQTMKMILQR